MNISKNRVLLSVVLTTVVIAVPGTASATSLWDESVNGDLSDDGLHPTSLGHLQSGSNVLSATFNAGGANPSPDYFSFTIPHGLVLEDIVLEDWQSSPTFEDIAFMAVQRGTVFDYTIPEERSADGLLGWTHLRSTQVGTSNILFEMSVSNLDPVTAGVAALYNQEADSNPYPASVLAEFPDLPDRLRGLSDQWVPGAEGFHTPLGAGSYSFWLRQGSDVSISTTLDFKTKPVEGDAAAIPEPTTTIGAAMLGLGFLLKKRKQKDVG